MANSDNEMTASPSPATPELSPESRTRRGTHEPQDEVASSAIARRTPARMDKALEHARLCARIADDNRAKNILLLDLRGATSLVDFFVIATATSRRQGNAVAIEVDQEMKKLGERKLGIEGSEEGRWTLIDYGDFVVHIFSDEARSYYALEEIWGDARQLDWQDPARARRPESPDVEGDESSSEA